MLRLVDKNLIFIMTALLLQPEITQNRSVVTFLLGIVLTEFTIYFFRDKGKLSILFFSLGIYAVGVFFLPALLFFAPILIYDVIWKFAESQNKMVLCGNGVLLLLFIMRWQQFKQPWQLLLWLLMVVFSMILAYRSQRQLRERKEMLRIRDNSVELEMSMKSKNQALMEKQDYEVHVATLQERNRIAREIHDNVGHMLSRSILQMGALMTIHKEEPLHSQLSSVSDSLNEAMNNIRESVHDLHDESIDLRQAVVDATSEMRKKYTVNLEYDMTAGVPCNVKYCMISIVKEAMSNVVKHSNGNKVTIILREHPAFFQLFIGDNGTDIDFSNPGIGLTNMRDRVETLGGTINFKYDEGFQIHVTIKRKQK